jgi:hypothetical protein
MTKSILELTHLATLSRNSVYHSSRLIFRARLALESEHICTTTH